MKVLVSACIMGVNCKYNGKNNENVTAINFLKDKEVISICPEVLAGMKIPRSCAEIVDGRVVDENGNDVSLEYDKAVAVALSKIQNEEIDLVIFLRDPLTSQAHETDIQALIRLCDVYHVPIATNLASAEIFINALDRGELSWREVRKTTSQRV